MKAKPKPTDDEAVALAKAQAELAAAVRELTSPRRVPVLQPDGTVAVGEVPGWIEQLRESVGTTRNGGAGSNGSPAPLNPGAVDVLTHVECSARVLHSRVLARSDRPVEEYLRAVLAEVGRWHDPMQVAAVGKAVARLLEGVRQQLDPRREVPIDEPCPHCEQRMVWRWDSSIRERLQVPALVLVVEDRAVVCRGCDSTWPAEFAGELIREATEHRERQARALPLRILRAVAAAMEMARQPVPEEMMTG